MTRSKIRQWLLFVVALLLGASVLAWLVWREGPEEIWENLLSFGPWPFIGFLALSFVNMCILAWRWKLIIGSYRQGKHRMSFWRVLLHRFGGFAFNYITPVGHVGGEPVRIALLTRDGIPVRQATSATILDTSFELASFAVFILIGILLASLSGVTNGGTIWLMFAAGLAVLVLLVGGLYLLMRGVGVIEYILRVSRLDRIKLMRGVCKEIINIEHLMTTFLRGNRKFIFLIAAISAVSITIRVIEVWYLAYFLGVVMNFGQAFLTSTLPGISLFLPIPGGVGVFEGSFATVFALLALPLNAIAFAVIIRARDLLFIIIGMIHTFMQGRAWIAQKLRKD